MSQENVEVVATRHGRLNQQHGTEAMLAYMDPEFEWVEASCPGRDYASRSPEEARVSKHCAEVLGELGCGRTRAIHRLRR